MKIKSLVTYIVIFMLSLACLKLSNDIEAIDKRVSYIHWQINSQLYNLSAIVSGVIPSVVFVDANGWTGSGVIIGPHEVLTAGHIVEDSEDFWITTIDGNEYQATGYSIDPNDDCAILYFEETFTNIAEFANSDFLELGQPVLVIGSPYGKDFFNTVTYGIISGLNRSVPYFGENGLITIDAACNPGNSGGPVFDMNGEIIGVFVGGRWRVDGFSVVTPSNICQELL